MARRDPKPGVRFRNASTAFIALGGLFALAAGGKLFDDPRDRTWQTIALGVGASLLAAAIATWVTIREESEENSQIGRARRLSELGLVDAFRNRGALGDDFWKRNIEKARRSYRVLGTANHRYLGTASRRETFSTAIRAAIDRNVEVEIIFLNPESDAASQRDNEEHRGTRADIAESMGHFWALRETLAAAKRSRLRLLEHNDTPTCGITWIDDELIVSTYLARKLNLETPGIILKRGEHSESLAEAYSGNYMEIREAAQPITKERVDELQGKVADWRQHGGQSESEISGDE